MCIRRWRPSFGDNQTSVPSAPVVISLFRFTCGSTVVCYINRVAVYRNRENSLPPPGLRSIFCVEQPLDGLMMGVCKGIYAKLRGGMKENKGEEVLKLTRHKQGDLIEFPLVVGFPLGR